MKCFVKFEDGGTLSALSLSLSLSLSLTYYSCPCSQSLISNQVFCFASIFTIRRNTPFPLKPSHQIAYQTNL